MTQDWWSQQQEFAGVKGSFLRVGANLFFRPVGNPQFHQLSTTEGSGYQETSRQGLFSFVDVLSGMTGTLACSASACTVHTDDTSSQPYAVTNSPDNVGTLRRLEEFDLRQAPALLMHMDGSNQLLYFSRRLYQPENGLNHAWLIDLENPAEPWLISRGDVTVMNSLESHRLILSIGDIEWPFYLTNDRRNGIWNQATYTQTDLAAYDITHDPATGKLVSFTPKG